MSLAKGTQIGPYEILAAIGAGGMGEVYHARDHRLDRAVAIKILSSTRGADPTQLERFQREARAIARLSHPHICTLHDVGEQDGQTFLVMEYIEGETLATRLERGALPLDQAVVIGVQIADALSAAHRKEVVHRDLKPGNVMLTASGVKLLDFGLAKLRHPDSAETAEDATKSILLTERGTVVGTVPYMAPEQIEGHEVDARTDIFSFGVMLYEMIAGRRPFAGDSRAALMAAIVGMEPPSLSSIQTSIPRSLERLVRRCLAKDVEFRWQTARDLAIELRWISEMGLKEIDATPPSPHRSRRALLVNGLVAAIVAVGAVAGTVALMRQRRPPVPEYLQATYQRGVVSSARFAADGRSFVYSASWQGQPYRIFLGRPGSPDARDLGLEAARILSVSDAGDMALLLGPQNIQQGFGLRTLARVPMAGGARRDLLDGVVDADWIPGTDSLAVIRDPGDDRPWSVEFPAGRTVHEARAAWSLRVSLDGSRIAFFEGPHLFGGAPEAMITVVDKTGGKSTLSRNWAGIGLAWASSGSEIWFTATHAGIRDQARADENRTRPPSLRAVSLSGVERVVHRAADWLMLHDVGTDGRVLLSRNTVRVGLSCQAPGESGERDLSWQIASQVTGLSPDGQMVIFADGLGGLTPAGNPTLFRRAMDGSVAVPLGEGNGGQLSPDKRWVLTELKGNLILLPTGAGSTITLPKGNVEQIGASRAWLDDSKRIVFNGVIGKQRRGYVQDISNGTPRAITPPGVVLPFNAAVRNGNSILGQSGDGWRLYPIEGGDAQPVPAFTARDVPVQWSEDGRFIYATGALEEAPPRADVFRIEVATGRRNLWKTLSPADPVGVEIFSGWTVMTPDARSYCYSYLRRLGDLFVVDGLR